MKLWTCTTCGNAEYLTFYPDCCSVCGGAMDNQEGRSTLSAADLDTLHYEAMEGMLAEEADCFRPHDTSWVEQAIIDFECEMDAGSLEPCTVIRLWQHGRPLTAAQQDLVDGALAANRVEMMLRVHQRAA